MREEASGPRAGGVPSAPGQGANAGAWAVRARRIGDVLRRLRGWRRIRFTGGGVAFTVGTTAVGFAALNTGNNLLYLLLGAMLGFIAVSGWLSEQAIRGLKIDRKIPRAVTVGRDLTLTYHARNENARLPSLAVEIFEQGLPEPGFLSHVPAGGQATTQSAHGFVRRGVYPLRTVTLSTGFPFGLFRKERDLEIPGEIVVWPRHDLAIADPAPGAGRESRGARSTRGALGWRGEYRNLRPYRAGDDPRDIHWKTSARMRSPVVREYERGAAETRWICLDTRGPQGDAAERAVEVAASLAARSLAEHRPFALYAGGAVVEPGADTDTLERVLDVLARADFAPDAPPPSPPVARERCVLVTLSGGAGFTDVLRVASTEAAP